MIVKGFVIFERTLLSRKESHNLAWSCAISDVLYCEALVDNNGHSWQDFSQWFSSTFFCVSYSKAIKKHKFCFAKSHRLFVTFFPHSFKLCSDAKTCNSFFVLTDKFSNLNLFKNSKNVQILLYKKSKKIILSF